MFQFQYGAIIRVPDNPVRYILCKFQFQYGAIIRSIASKVTISKNSVSIPIWCDYKSGVDYIAKITDWFQFQYGAIIRMLSLRNNGLFTLFQFQYGAIIRNDLPNRPCRRIQVSIPIWCDYKPGAAPQLFIFIVVSIPIWCDYKKFWT